MKEVERRLLARLKELDVQLATANLEHLALEVATIVGDDPTAEQVSCTLKMLLARQEFRLASQCWDGNAMWFGEPLANERAKLAESVGTVFANQLEQRLVEVLSALISEGPFHLQEGFGNPEGWAQEVASRALSCTGASPRAPQLREVLYQLFRGRERLEKRVVVSFFGEDDDPAEMMANLIMRRLEDAGRLFDESSLCA